MFDLNSASLTSVDFSFNEEEISTIMADFSLMFDLTSFLITEAILNFVVVVKLIPALVKKVNSTGSSLPPVPNPT